LTVVTLYIWLNRFVFERTRRKKNFVGHVFEQNTYILSFLCFYSTSFYFWTYFYFFHHERYNLVFMINVWLYFRSAPPEIRWNHRYFNSLCYMWQRILLFNILISLLNLYVSVIYVYIREIFCDLLRFCWIFYSI